eukprot:365709-Chlamydomonas_euryale.AAC.7
MDFIVQLPPTKPTHGATKGLTPCMLVCVDRLIKMVHLAPTFTTCMAEDAVDLFTTHVFAHHGLPESIITDRGPQFTGNFWTACMHCTIHGQLLDSLHAFGKNKAHATANPQRFTCRVTGRKNKGGNARNLHYMQCLGSYINT